MVERAPATIAPGIVLPMYFRFCGIAVFRNVRKPAWLSGFLDTLYPTVIQSDRTKKTATRLHYRMTGMIALRQLALTTVDRASLHWLLRMSPAKAVTEIFSIPAELKKF